MIDEKTGTAASNVIPFPRFPNSPRRSPQPSADAPSAAILPFPRHPELAPRADACVRIGLRRNGMFRIAVKFKLEAAQRVIVVLGNLSCALRRLELKPCPGPVGPGESASFMIEIRRDADFEYALALHGEAVHWRRLQEGVREANLRIVKLVLAHSLLSRR